MTDEDDALGSWQVLVKELLDELTEEDSRLDDTAEEESVDEESADDEAAALLTGGADDVGAGLEPPPPPQAANELITENEIRDLSRVINHSYIYLI